MGHPLNRVELPPLPKAEVNYEPAYEVLFIENGKSSGVAEEMARQILVYFDKEDDGEAVAIRIDRAELVLETFVDAILVKHGITPDPEPRQRSKKGYRETVITQIRHEEWELAPFSEAVYDTASQTLLVENGEASIVSKEMAKGVHVVYGKDYDGGPRLSTVAIRIDRAESVLKPFVDAILAKYGLKAKEAARENDAKAAYD